MKVEPAGTITKTFYLVKKAQSHGTGFSNSDQSSLRRTLVQLVGAGAVPAFAESFVGNAIKPAQVTALTSV